MAEQIDIASLNFDTDKLSQNLVKTRTEIDNVKNSLSDLRKENRDSVKSVGQLEKAQKELADAGEETSKEYKENAKELEKVTKAQEESTKSIVNQEGKLRILNKEQRELNKILDANRKGEVDSTAVMEKANAALAVNWNNQNEAFEAGKAMMALRKQLNPDIAEEAALMSELAKRTDEANEYQNQFNTDNEDRVKGIGKYKEGILGAIKEMNGFGGAAQSAGKGASGFASGISAGIPGLSGLTKGAQAFSATPLLLVVGLLVKSFQFLYEKFLGTQEAMDKITAITRPLMAIFDSMIGVVEKLGKYLFDAFSNPKQLLKDLVDFIETNVMNRLKAFGVILEAIANRDFKGLRDGIFQAATGVEDLVDKVKDAAQATKDFLNEAYELGVNLDNIQKDIEQRQSEITLQTASITSEMRKQEVIAKDQSKSSAEREKAVERQNELAKELIESERVILQLQLAQAIAKQSQNDSDRKDMTEVNKIQADIIALGDKQTETEKRNLGTIRQLRNDANREAAEANKERMRQVLELKKIDLETYVLLNEANKENAEQEIEFAQEVSAKKLDIMNEELRNKTVSQQQYNLNVQKLEVETARQEAEIRLFYATQDLNEEILIRQQMLDERKRITVESLFEEQEAIKGIEEEQRRLAKEALDANLIDRHEYNAQILEFETQKNEQLKEVNDAFDVQDREDRDLARMLENEQILLDLQDSWDLRREIENQAYEETLADLEQQREDGLLSEENYLKSLEILNQNHANMMMAIDKDIHNNKIDLAKNALSDLSQIAGEQSDVGKGFAIAAATIDMYQSAVSSYNSLSGIPIVGPVLGGIAAAAAVALGLKNISKIKSTRAQKYTGGYTGDGGVFTKTGNVHAGEVVWNQSDVMRAGGVNAVEAMRPTSDTFGSMPTGVPQEKDDSAMWRMVGEILGNSVEKGSEKGTEGGMVQAGANEFTRLKATF